MEHPLNPGTQTDFTFTNAAGCDSTVSVSVTELLATSSTVELSACTGTTADYNGTPLNPGQQMDFTFINAAGCDSTVSVSVLELTVYQENIELGTCEDSIFYAGMMLPLGSTELVFTSQGGCDSILNVQVTQYPEELTQVVLEACPGETVNYLGQALVAGDEITEVLSSQFGCDSTVQVSVQALQAPELDAMVEDDCPEVSSGMITGMITFETQGPYAFSLDGVNYVDNAVFNQVEGGAYTLFTQDANGCIASVDVTVNESAPLLIDISQDSMTCDKLTATLTASILSGDDGNLSFLWGDGSTELELQADTAGLYVFRVSNACQEVIQEIEIPAPVLEEAKLLYIPNAFSPNEDGNNDQFLPAPASGVEPMDYEFRVFNRWGSELFSTDDLFLGWDGKVKGQKQNVGPYIWFVKGKIRACGQEVDFYREGDVMLMR